VEVTCRTVQGRFLLSPSTELNEIILGVLGRAQRLYPVGLCGYVFLSNHYHLLLEVTDAQELSSFMGYLNSNLAREVARRTGWTDKIWARRYQAIPVSEEGTAQVARLAYVLAHGTKERLVGKPEEWPGVHCVRPLLAGEAVVEGLSGSIGPASITHVCEERRSSARNTRTSRRSPCRRCLAGTTFLRRPIAVGSRTLSA